MHCVSREGRGMRCFQCRSYSLVGKCHLISVGSCGRLVRLQDGPRLLKSTGNMAISEIRQGDIPPIDSDIGSINLAIWDIGTSQIQQGTGKVLSDRDMQHWHFLKSTYDIRTPPSRAPTGEPCRPGVSLWWPTVRRD